MNSSCNKKAPYLSIGVLNLIDKNNLSCHNMTLKERNI